MIVKDVDEMILFYGYVIFWITLLAHEMGHYYYARKYNLEVVKVSLGNGFKLFSIGVFDIHVLPLSGYVEVNDSNEVTSAGKKGWEELSKKEFFMFNNMASLSHAVAAFVIFLVLLSQPISTFITVMFLIINTLTILINVLPIPGTDAGDYVRDKKRLYETKKQRQFYGH